MMNCRRSLTSESPLTHGYNLAVVILCSLLLNQVSAQTGLSAQDQQELLDAHNHFRGIVNPTASNMETMVVAIIIIILI